jgi:chromate transporter
VLGTSYVLLIILDAILNTERFSLLTLFALFLRIGSTSFGGFMVLIAAVEDHVAVRHKLLTHEEILDGVSLATVLPGPIAVNTVAYVGYRLRGIAGAAACTIGVILPSFLLLLALSAAYFTWGQMPVVSKLFMGFIPAVTSIILVAAWNMRRKAIHGKLEALIALFTSVLMVWQSGFSLTIIVISGMAGWVLFRKHTIESAQKSDKNNRSTLLNVAVVPLAFTATFWSANSAMLLKLFITFAGMSLFLFGGGYVFIPLIQHTVVVSNGWLTQQEFVDGIAMGQITPGPVLISAVFIGYKISGLSGALVATIGIFVPPILLMIASSHALVHIKQSAVITAMLRGIRPAVIGMIVAAGISVGMTAQQHWISLLIFAAALFAQLKFKLDMVWIIPTSGLLGLLLY